MAYIHLLFYLKKTCASLYYFALGTKTSYAATFLLQSFISINYPNNYANNREDVYEISAPPNHMIMVYFEYFYFYGNTDSCGYDELKYYTGRLKENKLGLQ